MKRCVAIASTGRLAVDCTQSYSPKRAERFGELLAKHRGLGIELDEAFVATHIVPAGERQWAA